MSNEDEFLSAIKRDIDAGYRFVPFVGAGLSQPSGVPIVSEFARYLNFCLLRAIGIDPLYSTAKEIKYSAHPWDPRKYPWPAFTDGLMVGEGPLRLLTGNVLKELLEAVAMASPPADCTIRVSQDIRNEACRVRSDWKAALRFLSTLEVEKESALDTHFWKVRRKKSDPAVVDTFFQHLSEGCQPSLGHRMIHALSQALRIDTILTTNFDNLLEQAFALGDIPLKSFPVPKGTALPPVQTVLAQRSIVKLHGGNIAVLADEELDEAAAEINAARFCGYLVGRPFDHGTEIDANAKEQKVALLVCGCSGQDTRTRELLRSSLEKTRGLRVYWISYSSTGEQFIKGQFNEFFPPDRFRVFQSAQTGLVLLHLFQVISGSVPTAGAVFPAPWNLPLPPHLPVPKAPVDAYKTAHGQLRAVISASLDPAKNERKIILLKVAPETQGAMHLVANLCRKNHWDSRELTHCLWFDLANIAEPVGLFLRLVLALAHAHGEEDPISGLNLADFYSDTKSLSFRAALCQAVQTTVARGGKRCIVFVNAHAGIGCNSQFHRYRDKPRWLEEPAVRKLVETVTELAENPACGLTFVFVVCRRDRDRDRAVLRFYDIATRGWANISRQISLTESCAEFTPIVSSDNLGAGREKGRSDVATALEVFYAENPHQFRREFVYLLTLFQVPRYPAALARIFYRFWIAKNGGNKSLGEIREMIQNDFIPRLEEDAMIRRMDGGLIWMHWRVLGKLRAQFFDGVAGIVASDRLMLHSFVARWYGRLMLATADPLAANESVYHALEGIRNYCKFALEQGEPQLVDLHRARAAIGHAQQILGVAEDLWKQRLSDQFANRALHDTERRVGVTIFEVDKKFRRKLPPTEARILTESLVDDLRLLRPAVITLRASLYCLESEFSEVLKSEAKWRKDLAEDSADASGLELSVANAQLGLRRYRPADELLDHMLDKARITGPSAAYQPHAGDKFARIWANEQTSQQRIRVAVLLARRKLYSLLHQSQAAYIGASPRIVAPAEPPSPAEREQRWRDRCAQLGHALWYSDFALELLRLLSDTSDSFIFEQNIRLRVHAALCHALRAHGLDAETPSSFELAEALVCDAQAYIDEFPVKAPGVLRAIVELRRAEIHLIRVAGCKWFQEARRQARQPAASGEGSRKLTDEDRDVALGRLHDALRAFDQAERVLRLHPKSRWWWWVFLTLKAKTCECFFVLRFTMLRQQGKDRPFPRVIPPRVFDFVQFELARYLPDKSVNDIFQLARLSDSCLKILHAHPAHLLPSAQAKMTRRRIRDTCAKVCDRLERAFNETTASSSEVDPNVLRYAKAVLDEHTRWSEAVASS